MTTSQVRNALTFDFEDWYHGLEIPPAKSTRFERRIKQTGERLLEMLADAQVHATFFVLGEVAEQYPDIVKTIAAAHHEIGTHGTGHEFVYRLSQGQFRESMIRSVGTLEHLTGKKVLG